MPQSNDYLHFLLYAESNTYLFHILRIVFDEFKKGIEEVISNIDIMPV